MADWDTMLSQNYNPVQSDFLTERRAKLQEAKDRNAQAVAQMRAQQGHQFTRYEPTSRDEWLESQKNLTDQLFGNTLTQKAQDVENGLPFLNESGEGDSGQAGLAMSSSDFDSFSLQPDDVATDYDKGLFGFLAPNLAKTLSTLSKTNTDYRNQTREDIRDLNYQSALESYEMNDALAGIRSGLTGITPEELGLSLESGINPLSSDTIADYGLSSLGLTDKDVLDLALEHDLSIEDILSLEDVTTSEGDASSGTSSGSLGVDSFGTGVGDTPGGDTEGGTSLGGEGPGGTGPGDGGVGSPAGDEGGVGDS